MQNAGMQECRNYCGVLLTRGCLKEMSSILRVAGQKNYNCNVYEFILMRKIFIIFLLLFVLYIPVGLADGEGEGIRSERGKISEPAPVPSIFLLDKGVQSPQRIIDFMLGFNRELDTNYIKRLIKTYLVECSLEGINYEIAICQMCLETGFLRFGGSVSRFQNNFCGLGATDAYTAGDWFGSMEEGVRAHIQHLKAYASVDPIKTPVVDKRLKRVRRGTVITVYDLTGRWAADPDYGDKISYLLKRLYLN